MARPLTEGDQVGVDDVVQGTDLSNAIQGPLGQIIVPRPKPGYRFVRWLHREGLDDAWEPVRHDRPTARFVRAYYEPLPGWVRVRGTVPAD